MNLKRIVLALASLAALAMAVGASWRRSDPTLAAPIRLCARGAVAGAAASPPSCLQAAHLPPIVETR